LAAAILLLLSTPGAAVAQNLEWARQFGSTAGDTALGLAASASGTYAVGTTSGTLPGQSSAGGADAFVIKYDAGGNVLWTRQFGTSGTDQALAAAADSTGVYVVGVTDGMFPGQSSGGSSDVFVRKYDVSGNAVWTRQFGVASADQANGVAVDATGVYVAGYVNGALSGQTAAGGSDVFVRKYGLNGNELWTRQFGTTALDLARDVSVDEGGVYVAGEVGPAALPGQSPAGGVDAFARKYDLDGNEQWTRQFGTSSNDSAHGVAVDAVGIYVVGAVGGTLPGQSTAGGADAFLRKYDPSGSELWTRQFGSVGADGASGTAADPTGVYVAGFAGAALQGQTALGGSDALLVKYDANGNGRWVRQFGTSATDSISAVDADATGVHVSGYTQGTFESQSSAGSQDGFIAKLTPGGPPFLPFNAIVGGASYVRSVTPGSIASAFGFSLAPQNTAGLLVQAGGITAPVYAVTTSQINFQVPWDLNPSQQNFLVVTVDGNSTGPVSIPLATHAPGIFSTDASGSGQGAILIANTALVAAPAGMFPGSRPATRGEHISIFATGLGAVTNQPPTGVPATGNPASTTISAPTVTIGGVAAPVSFSGLAPGFFGLYQTNVEVPQNAPVGNAVPLLLTIGGVTSNAVTVAVQ
jgi:uncharacterized protein (TIGR03437 family)